MLVGREEHKGRLERERALAQFAQSHLHPASGKHEGFHVEQLGGKKVIEKKLDTFRTHTKQQTC